MSVPRPSMSIEFVVIARDDLFLHGKVRKLLRVSKGRIEFSWLFSVTALTNIVFSRLIDTSYPCQMQRNQTFSCLFRHYAKHHGLKKEDLVFSFVDELSPDESPESVHLMTNDEIVVVHRQSVDDVPSFPEPNTSMLASNFRQLLDQQWLSDITFVVGDAQESLRCHKAILFCRSEYFNAMFQPNGIGELNRDSVIVPGHDAKTFSRFLDYLYTGQVRDISSCNVEDIVNLITLADEYVAEELKSIAGFEAIKFLSDANLTKFIYLAMKYDISSLKKACSSYVKVRKSQLMENENFVTEVESTPECGRFFFEVLPCFDPNNLSFFTPYNTSSDSFENVNKRSRLHESNSTQIPGNASMISSSMMLFSAQPSPNYTTSSTASLSLQTPLHARENLFNSSSSSSSSNSNGNDV